MPCGYLAALAEPQRLSPVGQRGEFTASQQESGLLTWWFPGVLSLQAGAVPCSSSISWLHGALTAAFLL